MSERGIVVVGMIWYEYVPHIFSHCVMPTVFMSTMSSILVQTRSESYDPVSSFLEFSELDIDLTRQVSKACSTSAHHHANTA